MMKRFGTEERRITIRDVALRSGVSLGTASNALNGTGRVSELTRLRVSAAARSLGYQPSLAARAMKGIQGRLMAILTDGVAGPWYAELWEGLQPALKEAGYAVMAITIQKESLTLCQTLIDDGMVRGLAVLNAGVLPHQALTAICGQVPTVLLDAESPITGGRRFLVDNVGGVTRLLDHLWGLGHRDFLWLGGPRGTSLDADLRALAFHQLLESRGLEPERRRILPGGFRTSEARDTVMNLLTRGRAPRALCAVNDEAALGALQALKKEGRRVPQDIAVTGFDGLEASAWSDPPLTTVTVDRRALGEAIARSLLESQPLPAETILVPVGLAVRASTQAS